MPRWMTGQVVDIRDIGETLRLFSIALDLDEILTFIPGQFVVMDLPIGDKRLDRWRSYSIANTPNDKNILEFCIVKVPEGPATGYLFDQIAEGTTLRMKYPDGTFTILNHLDHELILVCTGTGVAPFRAMIKHIRDNKLKFEKIHLIFGTRHASTMLYRDEFEQFAAENDRFAYDVALSREKFNGYQGYVHDLYMGPYGQASAKRRFYLCGWQNMIDEAVANLIVKSGYAMSQVQYELYG